MTDHDIIELLLRLPEEERDTITSWLTECGLGEYDLTVPLLQLITTAEEHGDEGVRRVLTALVKQETAVGA